jgi:tryptophan synthase beta subunit
MSWIQRALPTLPPGTIVVGNLSGRGDKDVETVRRLIGGADDRGAGR